MEEFKNRILNIDCLEGMKSLPDESIDLIITDPPYGVEFSKGFDDSLEHVSACIEGWLSEMLRVLKDTSHCYIFVPTKEIDLWVSNVKKAGFNLMNILSTRTYTKNDYVKNNFSFNNQMIIYCCKGKAKRLNQVDFVKTSESWLKDKRNKNPHEYTYQYPAFLSYFSNEKTTSKSNNASGRHPCAKNTDFLKFLIQLSSEENGIVLDPFAGGGSTLLAAKDTGRKYLGYELNEEYFNSINDRLNPVKEK